jgi:hypothetical protein
MKESWSETLWNEEIRRCGVVDNAEKVREARLRWYEHVIRRDEGKLVRDIIEEEIRRRYGVAGDHLDYRKQPA